MRWTDLLGTSLLSLKQRPFRTALTVLGVMIGTMAVIVMVSLGIGMSESMMQSVATNDSLTQVTVIGSKAKNPVDPQYKALNESGIRELAKMDGVSAVIPVYTAQANFRVPPYEEAWAQISGVRVSDMEDFGLEIGKGQLPVSHTALQLVAGSKIEYNMSTSTTQPPENVDLVNQPIFITFQGAGAGSQGSMAPAQQAPDGSSFGKRIVVPVVGELADNGSAFSMNDYQFFADMDALIAELHKQSGSAPLPGQTSASADPAKGNFLYSSIVLRTDTVQDAEALTTILRDAGWEAQSDIEFMKEIQRIGFVVQAVFGGIGFISLLVAAIGIANTMMMSVYERTKEIGIMKVLGASLGDIRKTFLIESATIGFLGGLIGLILSILLSMLMNTVLGAMAEGADISVIPPWLMLAAVAFSTGVGTLAGLAPAQRAMKLSPLAAIRAE